MNSEHRNTVFKMVWDIQDVAVCPAFLHFLAYAVLHSWLFAQQLLNNWANTHATYWNMQQNDTLKRSIKVIYLLGLSSQIKFGMSEVCKHALFLIQPMIYPLPFFIVYCNIVFVSTKMTISVVLPNTVLQIFVMLIRINLLNTFLDMLHMDFENSWQDIIPYIAS